MQIYFILVESTYLKYYSMSIANFNLLNNGQTDDSFVGESNLSC